MLPVSGQCICGISFRKCHALQLLQVHLSTPHAGGGEHGRDVGRQVRRSSLLKHHPPVRCCPAGAFPEIQVAQYPLDMGRPGAAGGAKSGAGVSNKTLAITVGADGEVNYDAIVKQGRNRDKWVASTQGAMVPKLDKLKDVRAPLSPRLSPSLLLKPSMPLVLLVAVRAQPLHGASRARIPRMQTSRCPVP